MQGSKIHAHYEITKFLGLGRFGETYLAKSKDLPGRPDCVVKRFCFPGQDKPLALIKKSFDEQVEVLYRLGQHDRIPTVLAQLVDGEHLYLIQEYIDGQLLSQELQPGQPWRVDRVVEFLQDTLSTLEFLHHQNFIHQDINPANWMRRWSDGKFVLLGCSGAKDRASIWSQPVDERPLELVGTPGYMPFEQEDYNPQFNTDLYALGTIAIQALTGTFPIERHPDSYELQWRQLTSANLKLVEILDRLVRPDYRNRYQLAREVLDDLEKFSASQRQPSPWERLRPHVIFGTAAVALMAGLAIPRLLPMGEVATPPLAITPVQAVTPSGWQLYQAPGWQMAYKPQWEKRPPTGTVPGEQALFVLSGGKTSGEAQVILWQEALAAGTTLETYTQKSLAEIQQFFPGANGLESGTTQLADRPAYLATYNGRHQGKEVKILEVWVVDNGVAKGLQYQAPMGEYYQHLPIVMTAIGTVQLNP
jgi:eukaryotic-like serine/threonine-protein kinase